MYFIVLGKKRRDKMDEDKKIELCRDRCITAGIAFTTAVKDEAMMFPINVRGWVSEDDLKIPASELAMHIGASDKKLLAWSLGENYAHIIYEEDGCCSYGHGLPSEVLSHRLLEITKKILGKKGN